MLLPLAQSHPTAALQLESLLTSFEYLGCTLGQTYKPQHWDKNAPVIEERRKRKDRPHQELVFCQSETATDVQL